MSRVVVDTRSIASHIRENRTSLESYVASVNSNVKLFNLRVKVNRKVLKAIGNTQIIL